MSARNDLDIDWWLEKQFTYLNQAQIEAILVDANESYHVWGRGTGKTSGVLAYKYKRNSELMPQSCGFIVQRTYQAFMTRIFPSLVGGLRRLNMERGIDYEVGKRLKGAKEPFEPPANYDNFIHFKNGSGVHIISQDRAGSSNGLNTDYGGGDEAKYLDYEQFTEETLPTMRANRTLFKNIHAWQSLTFLTSMPTLVDQKWILEKEKRMQPERIAIIKQFASKQLEIWEQLRKYSPTSSNYKALAAYLNKIEEAMNFYRRYGQKDDDPTVFFSKASSLDNIAVLGVDYIRKQMNNLPDFQFRTEILNEDIIQVADAFYPKLSIQKHTYQPRYDNAYLESLHYNQEKIDNLDCIIDQDRDDTEPLIISVDFGANITTMWVGQDLPHEYRMINNMYVKHPDLIKELAAQLVSYYRNHNTKAIYYPYYGTESARVLNDTLKYPEQLAELLRSSGWTVYLEYMGQQPSYHERYLFYQELFDDDWQGKPIRFNREKCSNGLISLSQARTKHTSKGIEKDKSSERKKGMPQEHATHYSDGFDTQTDWYYLRGRSRRTAFLPSR